MAIETLDDVVESIMDCLGIYGAHDHDQDDSGEQCHCRCCESSSLRSRIMEAVGVEQKLARQNAKESLVNAPQHSESKMPTLEECQGHILNSWPESRKCGHGDVVKRVYDYICRHIGLR
jgi:hypothetical protein